MMTSLAGKTLLIVGLGKTGQAVAALAKAFRMTVVGTRARPEDMNNVDEVHASDALPKLCSRADFVVVATPLLASTKSLVGAHAIGSLKPGAVLVDVSRGQVVDHGALLKALQNGQLRGAALDVFPQEPLPADAPIWEAKNTILSPHCSSVFEGWDVASFDLFISNLTRWRAQQPLHNVVDPKRGY